MRPIDADALLEKLQRMIDYCENDNQVNGLTALFQVGDAIMDCPTLTPPNEWVSVEEAMPPEHETVLCIVSGKPKPNITLEDAYQLGSWNKADGWIIDEWLDWEGANVTWWMKLPETPYRRPPEGQEDT